MTAAQREQLYAFFSRLWVKEVDVPFLETLRSPLGREVLPGVTSYDDLDTDFTNLTIVNLAPYESFYRRDDGLIEAGAVNPVAQFFKQYGFEADLAAARALAPDHLGIELELMSVLCGRERESAQVREIQREFLVTHLLTWAPMYFFAVKRCARTALYREAADATLQFLCADLEALS